MQTMTIDGTLLDHGGVRLDPDARPAANRVQLRGTRAACKHFLFTVGYELRHKARYGADTYRIYDDEGAWCGTFVDGATARLDFDADWFVRHV
jgi:hypothetical protein